MSGMIVRIACFAGLIGGLWYITNALAERKLYKEAHKKQVEQLELNFKRQENLEATLARRDLELKEISDKERKFRHDEEQAKSDPVYKDWSDSPLPVTALRLLNSSSGE